MSKNYFEDFVLAEEIWEKKYKSDNDDNIEGTWDRVSLFVSNKSGYANDFYDILEDFKFIPGGRITEAAGTKNSYMMNCFVIDIEDSLEDIYDAIKKVAMISKKNGGVGFNVSKLRPVDSPLSGGGVSSGVVSFLKVFDASCDVIKTGSKNRRAALIAILDCDHPEIFEFIDAKRSEGVLTNFNISVGITDAFIKAVKEDGPWALQFKGKVYKVIKARELWDKLCYSGWMYNDPGLIFHDTINRDSNSRYLYELKASNPCGELSLPPEAACCLGNINLTKFIKVPFSDCLNWKDNFKWTKYIETIRLAVRFLDSVLDVGSYPYESNREIAQNERRIGLNGIAGLGSFLAMMKIPYDSELGREVANEIQKVFAITAYKASINLAKELGSFPKFNAEEYVKSDFITKLNKEDDTIIPDILKYGIRNIAIITIPPVGTGSLLAGNISNGCEPIFCLEYNRNILQPDGSKKTEAVEDYAWRAYKKLNKPDGDKPSFFKTSMEIDPMDHVNMQAAIQEYCDGNISKTNNLPNDYSLNGYKDLLMYAYDKGLHGFTTFRSGTREGVLVEKKEEVKVEEEVAPVASSTLAPRPRVLDGKTYKIKDIHGNVYVTINSFDDNGILKPWEIFIFSSNENQEMYAALGKTLSAIMRRNDDISFIIEDLKSIKSSTESGGYFTQEYGFVKSRPQHIGLIIEEFVQCISGKNEDKVVEYSTCPECKEEMFIKDGGCNKCLACGHSSCG